MNTNTDDLAKMKCRECGDIGTQSEVNDNHCYACGKDGTFPAEAPSDSGAELGGLPVRGVPPDHFICVGCGETVSEWSHLINEDCIVSDEDLRSEKIGEWECNHCGSQEWIDPANTESSDLPKDNG